MSHEDLEAANHLCKRFRAILLPFLNRLCIVDKNDEVFVLSLVVDLGLQSVSTRHAEQNLGGWFLS